MTKPNIKKTVTIFSTVFVFMKIQNFIFFPHRFILSTISCTFDFTHAYLITVNAKGGLITGQSGVIQSPNYPRPYPNSADITWVLMGPSAGRISITFKTFSLEEDSACRYDFVELRDGAASSSPFIGKFCGGNLPTTYLSADNSLFVKFKSDVSENRLGFQANWKWLPTGTSPAYSKTDRHQSSSGILLF